MKLKNKRRKQTLVGGHNVLAPQAAFDEDLAQALRRHNRAPEGRESAKIKSPEIEAAPLAIAAVVPNIAGGLARVGNQYMKILCLGWTPNGVGSKR